MPVTDSVIPMASQLGLASGSVSGLEPESALASVMPMASQALESAWVPGLASGSVPVWEQDSGSVPAWVPV